MTLPAHTLRTLREATNRIGGMNTDDVNRLIGAASALLDAAERAGRLEEALREIRTGKAHADNEHPLGEWFSMASRFMNIARTALAERTPTP